MLTRRNIIGSLLAAPVIIKTSGLLMPIKPLKYKMLRPGIYWSDSSIHTYVKPGHLYHNHDTNTLYIFTADKKWLRLSA